MKYTYLIFDLFIIITPLFGVRLYKNSQRLNYKLALMSITISALPYLIWDYLVVDLFWSFNSKYITQIYIGKLPVEEIIFFFAIPFAMLTLWVNLGFIKERISMIIEIFIILVLCIGLFYFANMQIWYSTTATAAILASYFIDIVLKTNLFKLKKFYILMIITGIFTIIFNNILTSLPVVMYNSDMITNLFIFTMPVEDMLFGIGLISLNLIFYEYLLAKKVNFPKIME